MVWDPLFFAVFYDWMIAGASCMCCILSITEAGKQPEQPRSKTSRQFSISAVQLKSAAKLSEEFRLWTVNGKGNDTDTRKKKQKVRYFLLFWTVSCSYITALLLFLSKIRVSRLSLSSSTPVLVLWQPGKIQVSWERWIRGDSPLLPIDSRVKEPRTRTLWVFLTALITLCLIFGTVGRVFHGFLRTRRLSFLCSECQSTFQEKKKKTTKILLHEQQDWSSSTPDFCGLTPKAPLLWEIRIS